MTAHAEMKRMRHPPESIGDRSAEHPRPVTAGVRIHKTRSADREIGVCRLMRGARRGKPRRQAAGASSRTPTSPISWVRRNPDATKQEIAKAPSTILVKFSSICVVDQWPLQAILAIVFDVMQGITDIRKAERRLLPDLWRSLGLGQRPREQEGIRLAPGSADGRVAHPSPLYFPPWTSERGRIIPH